jgi:hypothetical protein
MIIRTKDWKNETRDIELIKHDDGILYCSNCYQNECNACVQPDLCECQHEELN